MNHSDESLVEMDGAQVGHSLSGFGINLLCRDVEASLAFLHEVLGFSIVRSSDSYAIARLDQQLFQLHVDATYAENPLLGLLPEADVRGAGVELRLYDVDPEAAEKRALAGGYTVLQSCTDKPHGLRECYLLDPDGYCWIPSRPA